MPPDSMSVVPDDVSSSINVTISFTSQLLPDGSICAQFASGDAQYTQQEVSVHQSIQQLKQSLHDQGFTPVPAATKLIFADTELPCSETLAAHGVTTGATIVCEFHPGFQILLLPAKFGVHDREEEPGVQEAHEAPPQLVRIWDNERVSSVLSRLSNRFDSDQETNPIWFLYGVGANQLVRLTGEPSAERLVCDTPGLTAGAVLVREQFDSKQ